MEENKTYSVVISDTAEIDLNEIYSYIADVLQSESNAEKQIARLKNEILDLDFMPFTYHAYPKEPWKSRGLRYFAVDNYTVFYIPDEKSATVTITRVLYGKRNFDVVL